jgi:glucosylceramidase
MTTTGTSSPAETEQSGAQAGSDGAGVEWVTTTQTDPWNQRPALKLDTAEALWGKGEPPNIIVTRENGAQTVEGFGACFSELGWTSLSLLTEEERDGILRELFEPGVGANLTICRMPLGANDFSRNWYSYDETPDDFELEDFSISNDLETLVPFIKAAKTFQPDLKLWASPWSPPTWMKYNKHYAAALPRAWQEAADNGLMPDQVGSEGTDMFIQEERYFKCYAAYFGRFIDEYRRLGIDIGMVMQQNEFNSPQVFPSCTWTPEGLARFTGYLGPEMEQRSVEVFLGTLERPRSEIVDECLSDPDAARYVKGVGMQWAGRGAIPEVRRKHPELRLYQTEQECGDGLNDWRFCRHAWALMKHFFQNGTSAYNYWNISLEKGGVSRWGWKQNSFVVVDPDSKSFTFTHEYYLMKHVSHFVQPGAKYLPTFSWTGHENQIAFANPDGSTVMVLQNDLSEEMPVSVLIGDRSFSATLPADSFNTLVVR